MHSFRLTLIPTLFLSVACGDGSGGTDAEPITGSDAGVKDSGYRVSTCPTQPEPECNAASACAESTPAQTNCTACLPTNKHVCRRGRCARPEPLGSADLINYKFQLTAQTLSAVRSFSYYVVDAETTGGRGLTCDDFYEGTVELSLGCLNMLSSRGKKFSSESGGNQPTITFSQFASVEKTLLIVLAYAEEPQEQSVPIGISCATYDLVGPGQGLAQVAGDMMRPIQ